MRAGVWIALALAASLGAGGCAVHPFCLDCADATDGPDQLDAPDQPEAAEAGDPQSEDDAQDADAEGSCVGVDTSIDPLNCGACGNVCMPANAFPSCTAGICGVAMCLAQFYDCDGATTYGCERFCAVTGTLDVCDGVDNDCDCAVDEDVNTATDPTNCGSCGNTCYFLNATATCVASVCRMGICRLGYVDLNGDPADGCEYACTTVSVMEIACDGRDDDCNGPIDDGDPEGGLSCGSSVGACSSGLTHCCTSARVGTDADCTAGTIGRVYCEGETLGVPEVCDTLDNDCNGVTDELWDLTRDPLNCNACGRVCTFPNAVPLCAAGVCGIDRCDLGWWNLDGDPANGCEYRCDQLSTTEVCNARDDDCNGLTDEAPLVQPAVNPCVPFGCSGPSCPCWGINPACVSGVWRCNYVGNPLIDVDGSGALVVNELRCDDVDNNCNGIVDDSWPSKGLACTNGALGECARSGTYICDVGTGNSLVCTAPPPGAPAAEVCDGRDNNCNGLLDDGAADDWVMFTLSAGGMRWIYRYEASRPDATAVSPGALTHRPCSLVGRLPWTNVTYPQAAAACTAIGAHLCNETTEWQRACETSAGTPCRWSYDTACTTYSASKCNGNDYDFDPGTPAINEDGILPAGSLVNCYANWGGTARAFDLSGNVKEWTLARAAGINPLRGGSYNNTSTGISCSFNFTVADNTFQFPNVGFRCCRDTAP